MSNNERKSNMPNKATTLNPNAQEFVPSSLRSTHDALERSNTTRLAAPGSSKETVTDQSDSAVPNNSDDEAHQYWQHQLPDDITPDFKVMGQDEPHRPESLSLTGLSINDGIGASIFSPSQASSLQHRASPFSKDKLSSMAKIGFPNPAYAEEQLSANVMGATATPWVKSLRNSGQYNTTRRDMGPYNGDSSAGAPMQNLHLADTYYGNVQNLESTMEILSQLENKVDGRLNQNLRSISFPLPSPPSPVAYTQNGLTKYDKEAAGLSSNTYRSPSAMLTDDMVSPSAVREHVSLDAPRWKYRTNSLPVAGLGSSRSSQLLASSYNSEMISSNKLQSSGRIQMPPAWLENGEAAANMYLEPKEEVRDHSSLRNAFVEQERQSYLTGSNALAKELNLKEFYSLQSRLAQEKARETMYRQRIQMPELQGYMQELNPPIDLCGLHGSEALHVLNYELDNRRKIVRSAGRRLQVIIISSTRTPARLTGAVEQYLLDHGIPYTQSLPGLFRVVLQ